MSASDEKRQLNAGGQRTEVSARVQYECVRLIASYLIMNDTGGLFILRAVVCKKGASEEGTMKDNAH